MVSVLTAGLWGTWRKSAKKVMWRIWRAPVLGSSLWALMLRVLGAVSEDPVRLPVSGWEKHSPGVLSVLY